MIKLERPAAPKELTTQEAERLTALYKDKKTTVWREGYILDTLLLMSNSKCAYCEKRIDKDSMYFHVEHYHAKSAYPDEVVFWDNLLPACGDCNTKKSTLDTYKEPIVNPAIDNPQEHFCLSAYRFYGTTDIGKRTQSELFLNNRTRSRFEKGYQVLKSLDGLWEEIDAAKNPPTKRLLHRWHNDLLENVLFYALPDQEYCATLSTIILNNPSYQNVKNFFQAYNLWDDKLIEQETILQQYCLPIK
jgi:uncharacterized protein (TIGR02646 family)